MEDFRGTSSFEVELGVLVGAYTVMWQSDEVLVYAETLVETHILQHPTQP